MADCQKCGAPLPEDGTPCACEKSAERLPEEARERRHLFPLAAIPLILIVGVAALLIILFSVSGRSANTDYPLFREGLVPVAAEVGEGESKVVKWGYADQSGNIVIDTKFEMAKEFDQCGLAPVKQNGLWGYIDERGNFAIAVQFEDAEAFSGKGLACVKKDGSWGYINKRGNIVINPQFDSAYPFADNGLALFSIGGKYGFINTAGVYVIEPVYDAARSFDENGYAAVLAYQNWGMIDKHGEWVINPQFEAIHSFADNDLALVLKDGKYGFINRDGVYVVPPTYQYAEDFSQGLALIKQDDKYGFIDKNGKIAIAPAYTEAKSFAENGLAAVKMPAHADLWGYINKNGETVIAAQYTTADSFSGGLAAVEKDGVPAYIDKSGATVMSFSADHLYLSRMAADGYAIVIRRNEDSSHTYFIVGKNGKLSETGYLYVMPYSIVASPRVER